MSGKKKQSIQCRHVNCHLGITLSMNCLLQIPFLFLNIHDLHNTINCKSSKLRRIKIWRQKCIKLFCCNHIVGNLANTHCDILKTNKNEKKSERQMLEIPRRIYSYSLVIVWCVYFLSSEGIQFPKASGVTISTKFHRTQCLERTSTPHFEPTY